MQVCNVCGESKPLTEYARYRQGPRTKRTHDATCYTCRAAQQRARRETGLGRRRERLTSEARRRINTERLFKWLQRNPCVDCGESDPVVLELDHVRGVKHKPLASMVASSSWAAVEVELAKCDVRCCNCHRRRTAVQLGYYSYLGSDHLADAREALTGEAPLFASSPRPRMVHFGNLAQTTAEAVTAEGLVLNEGDQVVVFVEFVTEVGANGDYFLRAKSAAVIHAVPTDMTGADLAHQ